MNIVDLEARRIIERDSGVVKKVEDKREYSNEDEKHLKKGGAMKTKWSRCLMGPEGKIYLAANKMTPDGGKTLEEFRHDLGKKLGPELNYYWSDGLLLMIDGISVRQEGRGLYRFDTWRAEGSKAPLESLQPVTAGLSVPQAGDQISKTKSGWEGLFFFGPDNIVRMRDGTMLAPMQAHFETDRIVPADFQSKRETSYKLRTIIVKSEDEGLNWEYLSTVAVPHEDDPVGEGFDEPALMLLEGGELLCVMRTGHHFPLYCAWSADGGVSWSNPVYTGFERGCAPCLLKLSDGRIALAYGQRFPVGLSVPRLEKEFDWGKEGGDPGCGMVRLAINPDGRGRRWCDTVIGYNMGSCYTTIYEPEPGVIFCQTDHWCWKVEL